MTNDGRQESGRTGLDADMARRDASAVPGSDAGSDEEVEMDDRGGWTFEQEAAAGSIGGHAGTRMAQGLAPGDTIGGTSELAHHPGLAQDDATLPDALGSFAEADDEAREARDTRTA